jgi:hypothetical protein
VLLAQLGQPTKTTALLHEQFGKLYTVVDLPVQTKGFVPPRLISGSPVEPAYVGGNCLTGNARIHFVVGPDGVVASPYVETASDGPFGDLATKNLAAWRFQPATLNGRPVAVLNNTYSAFHCPIQLQTVVGLWQLKDQAIWIELGQDGSAYQCRVSPAGEVMTSKGRFVEPYWIVWQKYWGTMGLDRAGDMLTATVAQGIDYEFWRAPAPMAMTTACGGARHGS